MNNFIKIAFTVVEIRGFFAPWLFELKKEDKDFLLHAILSSLWLQNTVCVKLTSKTCTRGVLPRAFICELFQWEMRLAN